MKGNKPDFHYAMDAEKARVLILVKTKGII